MKLTWYGHAAFGITAADGTHIITDPYTPETSGYPPIRDAADVVIVSSETDSFHCRHDLIAGDPIAVNALDVAEQGGEHHAAGVPIRAVEAMEWDAHRGGNPDQNALYRFTVDGIDIGHMGDVGNPLNDEQMALFDGVDILLALTGGTPTIKLDDLQTVIQRTQPKLVVPMHFRTLTCKLMNIHWIESFLAYYDDSQVDFAFDTSVELSRDDLPETTRVLVLDYVR